MTARQTFEVLLTVGQSLKALPTTERLEVAYMLQSATEETLQSLRNAVLMAYHLQQESDVAIATGETKA